MGDGVGSPCSVLSCAAPCLEHRPDPSLCLCVCTMGFLLQVSSCLPLKMGFFIASERGVQHPRCLPYPSNRSKAAFLHSRGWEMLFPVGYCHIRKDVICSTLALSIPLVSSSPQLGAEGSPACNSQGFLLVSLVRGCSPAASRLFCLVVTPTAPLGYYFPLSLCFLETAITERLCAEIDQGKQREGKGEDAPVLFCDKVLGCIEAAGTSRAPPPLHEHPCWEPTSLGRPREDSSLSGKSFVKAPGNPSRRLCLSLDVSISNSCKSQRRVCVCFVISIPQEGPSPARERFAPGCFCSQHAPCWDGCCLARSGAVPWAGEGLSIPLSWRFFLLAGLLGGSPGLGRTHFPSGSDWLPH